MAIERTSPPSGISQIQSKDPSEIQQQKRKSTSSQIKEEGAQVKLSDAQAQLMQPGVEDINTERVEMLKQAILNGELSIDPAKIADKIIQQNYDLLKDK